MIRVIASRRGLYIRTLPGALLVKTRRSRRPRLMRSLTLAPHAGREVQALRPIDGFRAGLLTQGRCLAGGRCATETPPALDRSAGFHAIEMLPTPASSVARAAPATLTCRRRAGRAIPMPSAWVGGWADLRGAKTGPTHVIGSQGCAPGGLRAHQERAGHQHAEKSALPVGFAGAIAMARCLA